MTRLTDNRDDPGLNQPKGPNQQNEAYLILSDVERSKGFVRPVRRAYQHATCGAVTSMSLALAETYARDPKFYGATWCMGCNDHLPVGEFRWDTPDQDVVGS